MKNMFENCSNLTTLNIINFNFKYVMNLDDLFLGCEKVEKIIMKTEK